MSKFLTLAGLSHFLDRIKGIFVGAASDVTEGNVVTFGSDGKTISDSGFTIGASVPADAKFTDTTYSTATSSKSGLMSSSDKSKLNGVAAGAEVSGSAIVQGKTTAILQTRLETLKEDIQALSCRVDKHNQLQERMAKAECKIEELERNGKHE